MDFNELSTKKSNLYYDAFIMGLVGTYGIYSINKSNNKIVMRLKRNKDYLQRISTDSMDWIKQIYQMYLNKNISLSFAKEIMDFVQIYRKSDVITKINEEKLKHILNNLPSLVLQKLNGDIKLYMKAFISGAYTVEQLTNKFYLYGVRKKIETDFIILAKTLVRTSND